MRLRNELPEYYTYMSIYTYKKQIRLFVCCVYLYTYTPLALDEMQY